jgi:hypothetical protein
MCAKKSTYQKQNTDLRKYTAASREAATDCKKESEENRKQTTHILIQENARAGHVQKDRQIETRQNISRE